MTEAFQAYTEALNKQTEALQKGFVEFMQMNGTDVNAQLSPVPSMSKENIVSSEFIAPNEQYKISLQITKQCTDCPVRPSEIHESCGVTHMKEAALAAGIMDVVVSQDEHFKMSFDVYKDGVLIGSIHPKRENSKIISELEKHVNETVQIHTVLDKALEGRTFTNLIGEIVSVSQSKKDIAQEQHSDHHIMDDLLQEATLDLGEMI